MIEGERLRHTQCLLLLAEQLISFLYVKSLVGQRLLKMHIKCPKGSVLRLIACIILLNTEEYRNKVFK